MSLLRSSQLSVQPKATNLSWRDIIGRLIDGHLSASYRDLNMTNPSVSLIVGYLQVRYQSRGLLVVVLHLDGNTSRNKEPFN